MLHVGIANRGFERRFELADFVRVENADLADGLLLIDLVREVPEAMKPKKIQSSAGHKLEVVESESVRGCGRLIASIAATEGGAAIAVPPLSFRLREQ